MTNDKMTKARRPKPMRDLGFMLNENTFGALVTTYSEPHRLDHTAEHISATLAHFKSVSELAARVAEMQLRYPGRDLPHRCFSRKMGETGEKKSTGRH